MIPNFFLLGAPRCGTTTLYESLKQHPQIFLCPVKEPMFFLLEGEKDFFPGPKSPQGPHRWEDYQALFMGAGGAKAVGEASPCYLSSAKAALGIKQRLPASRFIAILRNPVDRAYSHFLFHRLQNEEPIADFEKAISAEEERSRQGWFSFWNYREMGFYGRQIERYYSLFDPHQFRFFLFEDLAADPQSLLAECFRFLGVDDAFRVRLPAKYNPSGVPKNGLIQDFLTKPNLVKKALKPLLSEKTQYNILSVFLNRNLSKPPLSTEVRHRVLGIYREDILKTQQLIHRDLSVWLKD